MKFIIAKIVTFFKSRDMKNNEENEILTVEIEAANKEQYEFSHNRSLRWFDLKNVSGKFRKKVLLIQCNKNPKMENVNALW